MSKEKLPMSTDNRRFRSTARPSISRKTTEELIEKSLNPTKRLNVPIEAGLYQQMKQQAVAEDRTMAEITRELWEGYLAQDSEGQ